MWLSRLSEAGMSAKGAEARCHAEETPSGTRSGGEPELLETWIVMSFCDQGTLEQAVRQGRFTNNLVRHLRARAFLLLAESSVGHVGAAHGHLPCDRRS